ETGPDPAMERGVRPVDGPNCETVLDRVAVDVFDMGAQVVLVEQAAFPESTLPAAAHATRDLARTRLAFVRNAPGERRFQPSPSSRIVGIAFRQSPDAMEMIRQHHDRDEVEWQRRPGFAKGSTERVDVRGQDAIAAAFEVDGEET